MSTGTRSTQVTGRRARPLFLGRGESGLEANPVLQGFHDGARCRVCVDGEQCNKRVDDPSNPDTPHLCESHLKWMRTGKLKRMLCPVFHARTGEQCSRSRNEPGSGCGYCSTHYQAARRGSAPGIQRRQSKQGREQEDNVSFRLRELPKALLKEQMDKENLAMSDGWKRLLYDFLVDCGYGPALVKDKEVLAEMRQLGLTKLLKRHKLIPSDA